MAPHTRVAASACSFCGLQGYVMANSDVQYHYWAEVERPYVSSWTARLCATFGWVVTGIRLHTAVCCILCTL